MFSSDGVTLAFWNGTALDSRMQHAVANRGIISTEPSDAGYGLLDFANQNPVGQTFVAEDPFVSLRLDIQDGNSFNNPTLQITVRLLQGAGPFGSILQTFVFTTAGPQDMDLIPLLVGGVYSFTISGLNNRGGAGGRQADVYLGGYNFGSNGASLGFTADLAFTITPLAAPPTPTE